MSSSSWKKFLALLRQEWMPFLVNAGFEGDGERFQRNLGDVLHVIGLQKNKYGGSCCVNLGIHLSFLPLPGGFPQAGVPVRVESCEFQWRLKPPGYTEYWWAYEQSAAAHLPLGMLREESRSPAEQARHLASNFEKFGEPAFQRLGTVEDIATLIKLEDLDKGWPIVPEYAFTAARACLTMARIHKHLGNDDLARRFAQAGLQRIGNAKGLVEELQKLSFAEPN